jgi:hypothetical protein
MQINGINGGMSAARILHIPLSGRDRRHYANELRKAEREYERLTREAEAAHAAADRALAEAHRLDCELWSARLFRTNCRRVSPTLSMAAVRCWKSNAATAITRKPSTWRT